MSLLEQARGSRASFRLAQELVVTSSRRVFQPRVQLSCRSMSERRLNSAPLGMGFAAQAMTKAARSPLLPEMNRVVGVPRFPMAGRQCRAYDAWSPAQRYFVKRDHMVAAQASRTFHSTGVGLLDDLAPKIALKGGGPGDPSGSGQVWEMTNPDGDSQLYLDASETVTCIKNWAETRCKIAGVYRKSDPIPSLIVSGLIKTGKTCTLNQVLPAVLVETLSKLPPEHPLKGMVVLQLNALTLEHQEGGTVLLCNLLQVVVEWVECTKVPVEAAAWQKAQSVLAKAPDTPHLRSLAGRAIVELFDGFRAPVLVLLDELHALLQPTDTRGKLDLSGAIYIRDNVLRRVLIESPPTVLWAVTGSSMALVWMALAAMPVNGAAPLLRTWPVHLPSEFPPSLMQELAIHMQQRLGLQKDVVELLLKGSGPSPALFTEIVMTWHSLAQAKDTNMGAFIASFLHYKMLEEVKKEWTLSLAQMTDVQRSGLLDMAYTMTGANIDNLDTGIRSFLLPHLQQTPQGRYYLKDRFQRQLLRAAIDRGGKVRSNWSGLESGLTLAQLDWGWHLIRLGEVADYLLELRSSHDKVIPKNMDGVGEFRCMLQDLVKKARGQLPKGKRSVVRRWEALRAFTQVLDSPHNEQARDWYYGKGKEKLKSDLDFLAFFLRLSRNVLAHQKPWDGPDLVDVKVVLALPELVGMNPEDLSDKVRDGMSALAPATIQAATEAAAAEDGDNG